MQRVSQGGGEINAGGSVVKKKNCRPLSFLSFSLRLWYGKYNVLCICKARCNPVVTETVLSFHLGLYFLKAGDNDVWFPNVIF